MNKIVEFSFHSDDSFGLLVTGLQIRPKKPDVVPMLDLNCLPEYVTSSEEDDH